LFNWSLEAGPVYTCVFGSQKWIVVNSAEAVKDLIVDRGAVYSSRKLPDSVTQSIFQGGSFAFMPYGPNWRNLRRIAHSGLTKKKIVTYQPILDERRKNFIRNIYDLSIENDKKAVDISQLIEHYTMTSILAICFGDMCSFEPGDPILHKAFSLTNLASKALSPCDQVKEFFPFLQKLWSIDRSKYIDIGQQIVSFYQDLLRQFKALENKQACFLKEIIEKNTLTELQIAYFIALFVGAGSETTTSTLEWAFAYLANHPEIQDKAYEEIQRVIGTDKLPRFKDESHMPYIQCIIHEALRIRPPAPTSIPHSTTKDDVYNGWYIPEGTTVLVNLFAVHRDSERYANPDVFCPERHLDFFENSQNDRKFSQKTDDRPHLGFSTGRRVCVGIHLAERTMFMALSSVLACFKIERTSAGMIDVNQCRDLHGATWAIPHYKIHLVPRHDQV
ncbi:cytochrome P450, partial [Sporodiniella umbellata]